MHNIYEKYIQRCFDLAVLGAGAVSPNPMVGAVLVYKDRIIGEGYHKKHGTAHAEVNALASVKPEDKHLISQSTLFVSLEPCCIFGKTPPCTQLILKHKIPKVVISCLDFTPEVAGNGVAILRKAGVEVVSGVLEKKGKEISSIRNTFVTKNRPYIILKYAQSSDGFMGKFDEPIWLTNSLSKKLVHKWRSETDAILVGTNTAQIDNPKLTNRLYFGKSPLRIVFDRTLKLNKQLHIVNPPSKTIVVCETMPPPSTEHLEYLRLKFDEKFLPNLLHFLFERKISSLTVEGGQKTLQKFIDQQLWDEARVFVSRKKLFNGVQAPKNSIEPVYKEYIHDDVLYLYKFKD